MSDDNEETQGPAFFIPMPSEILAEMQRRHDQHQMEADDYYHSLARMFDSFNKEQLETFRTMMHGLLQISDGPVQANLALYEGMIVGILHSKFNVCLACNRDHDEVMAQQMEAQALQEETPPAMDGGDPFKPAQPTADLQIDQVGILSDAQLAAMEEYNLDDVRSAEDGRLLGFICINCGMRYVSIEDRMRRPTGKAGCSGCVNKEKWG